MGGRSALVSLAAVVAAVSVSFVDAFQASRSSAVMGPSSLHGFSSLRSTALSPNKQTGFSPAAALAAPHLVRQSTSSTGVFVSGLANPFSSGVCLVQTFALQFMVVFHKHRLIRVGLSGVGIR